MTLAQLPHQTRLQSYLHLNVQNAHPALLRNVLDRLDARAVVVAAKLGVLDEALLLHQVQELFLGDEVVLAAVLLAVAGRPGGVRDAEAEARGVLVEEALQHGGLAGARGPGDDDGAGVCRGHGAGGGRGEWVGGGGSRGGVAGGAKDRRSAGGVRRGDVPVGSRGARSKDEAQGAVGGESGGAGQRQWHGEVLGGRAGGGAM